jgi:chromosome segregation ATPase
VADGERTFTEAEHFALLTDAVSRETASLSKATEQLESEKGALQVQVTTLEAELAAEKQAKDSVTAEFDKFKADLAELAAVAERKEDRVKAVKAAAPHLAEDYFTAERADTWASMSDETFAVLIEGLETAAKAAPAAEAAASTELPTETAALQGGASPTATKPDSSTTSRFLAARRGGASA